MLYRYMFFGKKQRSKGTYDHESKKPVIRASICTGEQVAGFKDIHTGLYEKNHADKGYG